MIAICSRVPSESEFERLGFGSAPLHAADGETLVEIRLRAGKERLQIGRHRAPDRSEKGVARRAPAVLDGVAQ